MQVIKWDDNEFSVGSTTLDDQHKKIVRIINELAQQPEHDLENESTYQLLLEMISYAQEHLEYEETLLSKINYPDLNEHKALHWAYMENVSNLLTDVTNGKPESIKNIIIFLTKWWQEHILHEDMKYKQKMEAL